MTAPSPKLLLVGGNGMLAQKIAALAKADYAITAVDLPEFDLTDREQVLSLVTELKPEVVINCAAYTNVDGCESEAALAERVNGTAVGYLAEAAKQVDATLAHISTDYVFDGAKETPYSEEDAPNPQSAYGRSKLLGEQALMASGIEKFFILRTSWLYGPGGNNFVETIARLAKERAELRIVADQVGSPTYTGDLAQAVLNLLALKDAAYGLYHFSNQGQCSWCEFAVAIVEQLKKAGETLAVEKITPIATHEYPLPAPRPAFSLMSKQKYVAATGAKPPQWQESLRQYFSER
ncbi:MAG: dTDP-4-dehydrorhamnose reductase [Desulfuromonadales bacterium]|nr:dTDP-4-dehydrorhamnose reductase [Desulfuromonadales bacterium]